MYLGPPGPPGTQGIPGPIGQKGEAGDIGSKGNFCAHYVLNLINISVHIYIYFDDLVPIDN